MEFHSKVVGDLSTNADNHATRLLKINHIEHALQRELIEVKTVAHIIVCRDGLWVVVDHDGLVTEFTSRVDGIH